MFRVKKDDYNTVQFIPEYKSNSVYSNHKPLRSGRKGFFAVIAIIIILIVAIVAGGIAYFTYFSPVKQFERAFTEGDFDTCTTLSHDNAFDSGYVSGIQDIVINAGQTLLEQYKAGQLSSSDATAQIQNLDTITDGVFSESFTPYLTEIQDIENIASLLGEAEASCASGRYDDAMDYIRQIIDGSASYSVDYTSEISALMEQYIYGFKNAVFTDFASLIRERNYDAIRETSNFILQYVNDTDITSFLTTVQSVEDGDTTTASAARTARSLASQADDDAAAQAAASDNNDQMTEE